MRSKQGATMAHRSIALALLLVVGVSCQGPGPGDKIVIVQPELLPLLEARAESEWRLRGAEGTLIITGYSAIPAGIRRKLALGESAEQPSAIDFRYVGTDDYQMTCRSGARKFVLECESGMISLDGDAPVPFGDFLETQKTDETDLLWPLDVVRQHLYPVTKGLLVPAELMVRWANNLGITEAPVPDAIAPAGGSSVACFVYNDAQLLCVAQDEPAMLYFVHQFPGSSAEVRWQYDRGADEVLPPGVMKTMTVLDPSSAGQYRSEIERIRLPGNKAIANGAIS